MPGSSPPTPCCVATFAALPHSMVRCNSCAATWFYAALQQRAATQHIAMQHCALQHYMVRCTIEILIYFDLFALLCEIVCYCVISLN